LTKLFTGEILPYYDEAEPATLRIFGNDKWDLFQLRSKFGIVSMDLQSRFDESTSIYEVICSGFFSSLDVYRDKVVTERMRSKVVSCARLMGIDDILLRPIGAVSLGEMRRAMIARALVLEPEILLLDEPMTGLDIVMRSKFRMMFDHLIEAGITLIMITHDLLDIPVSVRRVIAMKDGSILYDGPKNIVLNDDRVSEVFGESIKVIEDKGTYQMYIREGAGQ